VSSALMIHPLSESHIANSLQLFWTRGIPSSSGDENAINFRIGRDILTFVHASTKYLINLKVFGHQSPLNQEGGPEN
jgi:hypothetical protein